jgi:hypothetical protein
MGKCMPDRLCKIYDRIIKEGKHPDCWKEVVIVPIKKANKPRYDTPKAWRALHMISTLSKTLERIIHTRIRDQTDKNLSTTQFGSRENRSCGDMMRVTNRWITETRNKGMEYTIIQADIEGGFDKITPEKILSEIPKEYKR